MRSSVTERLTLVLDATDAASVRCVLLRRGHSYLVFRVRRRTDRIGDVLAAIARILERRGWNPQLIRRLIVVEEPGPFSALRLTAGIANMWRVAARVQLFAARHPRVMPEHWRNVLPHLVSSARAVSVAQPRYGKPPSITKRRRSQRP